jgi:hypothetical protein
MRTLFVALALAGSAAPLGAQSHARAASAADPRLAAPAALVAEAAYTLPAPRARRGRALTPAMSALGGAVLGGWVGYIASQVSRSDWDKEEDGEFRTYRLSFTGGGAALGAMAGLLLRRAANERTVGPVAVRAPEDPGARGGETITQEEVSGSAARNAAELIQSLRPLWLQGRGTNTFSEGTRGESSGDGAGATVRVTQQGTGAIKVYLDNAFLGDVGTLRQIGLGAFAQVRFHDPAAATYRWGAGHSSGAIQLITRGAGQ